MQRIGRRFKCNLCPKKFDHLRSRQQHVRRSHGQWIEETIQDAQRRIKEIKAQVAKLEYGYVRRGR